MKPNSTALAVSLLSSVLLLNAQAATAQTDVAAERNRNAAGDDTARANLHAKRKPRRPRQLRPPAKPVAIPW